MQNRGRASERLRSAPARTKGGRADAARWLRCVAGLLGRLADALPGPGPLAYCPNDLLAFETNQLPFLFPCFLLKSTMALTAAPVPTRRRNGPNGRAGQLWPEGAQTAAAVAGVLSLLQNRFGTELVHKISGKANLDRGRRKLEPRRARLTAGQSGTARARETTGMQLGC